MSNENNQNRDVSMTTSTDENENGQAIAPILGGLQITQGQWGLAPPDASASSGREYMTAGHGGRQSSLVSQPSGNQYGYGTAAYPPYQHYYGPQSSSASAASLGLYPFRPKYVQEFPVLPSLKPEEIGCEIAEVDSSTHDAKGVILLFLNNNCSDSSNVIGGFRLYITDMRQVPAYIVKYRHIIKKKAAECLTKHLLDNQHPAGVGETITVDDFGINFSVASLSEEARSLSSTARKEGPLMYCHYPGYLKPLFLGYNEDHTPDYANTINVYIHLFHGDKRRSAIIKRNRETQATGGSAPKMQRTDYQSGSGYQGGQGNYQGGQRRGPNPLVAQVQETKAQGEKTLEIVSQLAKKMEEKEKEPPQPHYPAMPESQTPVVWNRQREDQCPHSL